MARATACGRGNPPVAVWNSARLRRSGVSQVPAHDEIFPAAGETPSHLSLLSSRPTMPAGTPKPLIDGAPVRCSRDAIGQPRVDQ